MNLRLILCLFLLFAITVNAQEEQDVAIHGTVTNADGEGIAGAEVTLLVAGLTATTDDEGAYSLLQTGINPARLSVPKTEKISLQKGILELRLAGTSPVEVGIFDIKGNLLQKELLSKASAGVYRLNILENAFASGKL